MSLNLLQLFISCLSPYLVPLLFSPSAICLSIPSHCLSLSFTPPPPLLLCFLHSFSILPSSPFLSQSSSESLSIHPTESHPSSLGRHMCCFDSKCSDGARGRKAATPRQQRHIISGKTHPTINY